MRSHEGENIMKAKVTVLAFIFVLAFAVLTGCSKSNSLYGNERSDAQVAGDVQSKITADSSLAGRAAEANRPFGHGALGAYDRIAKLRKEPAQRPVPRHAEL